MTRYLISFDDVWMTFPEEDVPVGDKASCEVVNEAKDAGVWSANAGLESRRASILSSGETATDASYPETTESSADP